MIIVDVLVAGLDSGMRRCDLESLELCMLGNADELYNCGADAVLHIRGGQHVSKPLLQALDTYILPGSHDKESHQNPRPPIKF